MRRSLRETRRAALILVALLAMAAGWILLREPVIGTRSDSSKVKEVAGRSSLPGSVAHPTTGAGTSDFSQTPPDLRTALAASITPPPASVARTQVSDFPGSGALKAGTSDPARSSVYTSRLTGHPGYYPPDDPESLSVITGRRDAPAVDLELSGGAASLEDLGRELLAAVNARDERALHALRVTKHEFAVICWPEFPESRPITHITLDDAWEMALPQSLAGASRTIGLYGGRELTLLRMETGGPFAYRNFVRHHGVVLVARDAATGEVMRLNFVPSVIERRGRFKALLFRD